MIISPKDFDGKTFYAMMKSGNGRKLYVCYQDGGHFFKVVENITSKILYEDLSLNGALKEFNGIDIRDTK